MTAECGSSFIKRKVHSTDQRLNLNRVNPEAFENITEREKPVLTLGATNICVVMERQTCIGAYADVNSS